MKGRTKALLMAFSPLLVISCLSYLLLTEASLPNWRTSWFNKAIGNIRPFKLTDAEVARSIAKKNQFGLGDIDFNYAAVVFLVIPSIIFTYATIDRSIFRDEELAPEGRLKVVADLFGLAGTIILSFFLIPVARHSVLLVALGWSPVHALRFHIWSGFTSYLYVLVHSLLYVVEWFKYQEGSVGDMLIPDKECFAFFAEEEYSEKCNREWYNFTGVIGTVAYTILSLTSLNWFRRRHYRLFYIFHMFSGTSLMLASLAHWRTFIVYLLPSLLYYMSSTTPVLLQALASRFRGGVKIVKVVKLANSGGCVEVQIDATADASANLARYSCMHIKLCVPKLSVVWHPFTVYQQPEDASTVRFLFRPIGPFTSDLSKALTGPNRPVTLVDGFYRGGNRATEALQHDDVTIVAGGVAVTPFLSMLSQLLTGLSNNEDDPSIRTRRVTLIWVCREEGLIVFVHDAFFEWMLQEAKLVREKYPTFEFQIKIHHTGGGKNAIEAQVGNTDVENAARSELEHGSDTEKSEVDVPSDPTTSSGMTRSCNDAEDANKAVTVSGGTPMSLARMMPARSLRMIDNLPIFIVFSFMLWLSFIIMFRWYQFREYTTNATGERLWGFFIGMIAIVTTSILFELWMVCFERTFPPVHADSFCVENSHGGDKKHFNEIKDCGTNRDEYEPGVRLERSTGRPHPSEYFQSARMAECPGLFFCGPVPLTEALKREAGKENSKFFGVTRYCLYEEPFDM
jgi:predicted ferric reductase